jgi:DNA-directed RNA polymerase specialized sigma24 family protein
LPPFRPLAQNHLERFDDDALIAYMRAAGRAGHESAALALAMLVHGVRPNVRRRVLMKVPPQDVDDVTDAILAKALLSDFGGTSGGQFWSWMNTITQRSIADYHRRGPGRIVTEPLEARDLAAPDEQTVETADAVDRVLAELSHEHRCVVERWLRGFAASEIDGVSDANVHQIVSRFRRALRGQLGAGEKGKAR